MQISFHLSIAVSDISIFLGLGFADRSDSFDFNMALCEHFKGLRVDTEIAKEEEEPRERLDLAVRNILRFPSIF